jgi:hypothetical protein
VVQWELHIYPCKVVGLEGPSIVGDIISTNNIDAWRNTITYKLAVVFGTTSGIVTVGHEWLKRETGVIRLVGAWECDPFWRCGTATNDVEVEAVRIDLDLATEIVCLELCHVTMHSDQFGSQDVCSGFDITRKLDFVAVAVI